MKTPRRDHTSDYVFDLTDYTEGQVLSHTSESVKLFQRKSGEKVVVCLSDPGDGSIAVLRRKCDPLWICYSRTIITLLGYTLPTPTFPYFGVVTPYMKCGSLENFILADRPKPEWFTPTAKSVIVTGLAVGLQRVHSNGIIHGGLRPTVVLLDDEFHFPRLSGFGEVSFEDDEFDQPQPTEAAYQRYRAPEQCDVGATNKVDVYAFGAILFELYTGERLFGQGLSTMQILFRSATGRFPPIPDSVPVFARNLIKKCWSGDPDARPTFSEIIDEFVERRFELFEGTDTKFVADYFAWASKP